VDLSGRKRGRIAAEPGPQVLLLLFVVFVSFVVKVI
jgi:hypothetical protein